VLERVAAAAGAEPPVFERAGSYFARAAEMEWMNLAPGVRLKILFDDGESGARTMLIEMDPGLPFPEHDHPAIEDLYLIAGDAWVGDVYMRAGDYCRAEAGTAHNDVRSGASGALAVVVSR
jgi:anti-sigma factor ChrR (cupin superfamily)